MVDELDRIKASLGDKSTNQQDDGDLQAQHTSKKIEEDSKSKLPNNGTEKTRKKVGKT
jgi:hypothetical protein